MPDNDESQDFGAMASPVRPYLAVVTGAASGLGRAFCLRLAADVDAHHIVAIDADEVGGMQTLDEIRKRRPWPPCEFVRLDVTDRDAWRQLADRLAADLQQGDFMPAPLLINNAGVCAAGETLSTDPDQWRRLMDVNFFGVLNGCQALGPLLRRWSSRQGPHAHIINVASVAGWLAGPSMGAYSASKAAAVALSESLYAELRPAGVHVTVVAPGFFRTDLLARGEFCTTRHRAEAERLSRRAKFTADDVARLALRASQRGQLYAVMGARARWLWRIKRLAPRLLQRIIASRYHRTFAGVGDDPARNRITPEP